MNIAIVEAHVIRFLSWYVILNRFHGTHTHKPPQKKVWRMWVCILSVNNSAQNVHFRSHFWPIRLRLRYIQWKRKYDYKIEVFSFLDERREKRAIYHSLKLGTRHMNAPVSPSLLKGCRQWLTRETTFDPTLSMLPPFFYLVGDWFERSDWLGRSPRRIISKTRHGLVECPLFKEIVR